MSKKTKSYLYKEDNNVSKKKYPQRVLAIVHSEDDIALSPLSEEFGEIDLLEDLDESNIEVGIYEFKGAKILRKEAKAVYEDIK